MELKVAEERLWSLEHVNILRLLPEEERQKLQKHCKVTSYKIGETFELFEKPGQMLYFLTRGRIRVSYSDGTSESANSKILEPGELFGESEHGAIGGGKLVAECIGPVTLCAIDADELEQFAENSPWFSLKITKREGLHFYTVEHHLHGMFFKNISKRLAHLLLILRRSHGAPVELGVQLTQAFTAQDLSRLLGSTPEAVERLLKEFCDLGLIERPGRHIIIKDVAGLHKR